MNGEIFMESPHKSAVIDPLVALGQTWRSLKQYDFGYGAETCILWVRFKHPLQSGMWVCDLTPETNHNTLFGVSIRDNFTVDFIRSNFEHLVRPPQPTISYVSGTIQPQKIQGT